MSLQCKFGIHDWGEKDYYIPGGLYFPGGFDLNRHLNPSHVNYRQTCKNCGKVKEGVIYDQNEIKRLNLRPG
jgi:hypothetical protein